MSTERGRGATASGEGHILLTMEELIKGPKTRTTLLISKDIDRMIAVCAAMERRQKSEIVNEALAAYLKDKKEVRSLSFK